MITLAIYGGGEFLLVVMWIIVLVFAFDFDCATDPIDARPWLLTGAFTHLIFDIIGSVVGACIACDDEESLGAMVTYGFTLLLNLFQICWFAIGFKVLTTMDCDAEWVLILAQVILGLAVLRMPKIIAFLVLECNK